MQESLEDLEGDSFSRGYFLKWREVWPPRGLQGCDVVNYAQHTWRWKNVRVRDAPNLWHRLSAFGARLWQDIEYHVRAFRGVFGKCANAKQNKTMKCQFSLQHKRPQKYRLHIRTVSGLGFWTSQFKLEISSPAVFDQKKVQSYDFRAAQLLKHVAASTSAN